MVAYSDLQADVDYARSLAEKKLGKGTRIVCGSEGWSAERDGASRITGKDLPTLTSFLEQLIDASEPQP
jgi:hypothetical protein